MGWTGVSIVVARIALLVIALAVLAGTPAQSVAALRLRDAGPIGTA
jgi:hypothetical protein